MKCQILFAGKNKKTRTNYFLPAELVKVYRGTEMSG